MVIAVIANGRVADVTMNEASSLETMNALANRGQQVSRIVTTESMFIAWSNGYNLCTDIDVIDGKPVTKIRMV